MIRCAYCDEEVEYYGSRVFQQRKTCLKCYKDLVRDLDKALAELVDPFA